MTIIAGVLSAGISLAFVYSQGPIVSVMKHHGAGDIPANFAVWALGLMGGALINVTYPAYLMTRNKSWHVLAESWREVALSVFMGFDFILGRADRKGYAAAGPVGSFGGIWCAAGDADARQPGSWIRNWRVARCYRH